MRNKSLTLAIVIPVYNEEGYLNACLDSIVSQTIKPDEVIVVDNNSSDSSVEIASRYDFVTVLHEERQHQTFAQATGFNHARSDILGRIDADSILSPDWVKNIKNGFAVNPNVIAITGDADPYDTYSKPLSLFFFHAYYAIARKIAGHRLLWGANMALRRDAWDEVKDKVRLKADIWEDYDLAFCLARLGSGQIIFMSGIPVGVSFRAVHKPLRVQFEYHFRAQRTFYYRLNIFKTAVFFIICGLTSLFILYPLTVIDKFLTKFILPARKTAATERG